MFSNFIRSTTSVRLIFGTVYLRSNVENSLKSFITVCWMTCNFMWLAMLQFTPFTAVFKFTLYDRENKAILIPLCHVTYNFIQNHNYWRDLNKFPAFTLNPFFSMASFHIKSLLAHSSKESAMMTRSSAYRSSQGTPARNSRDKASTHIIIYSYTTRGYDHPANHFLMRQNFCFQHSFGMVGNKGANI